MTTAIAPTFAVSTERVITAHSGHETLILRYDGEHAGSIAIDENDCGVVPTISCDHHALADLAQALSQALPTGAGEAWSKEIVTVQRGTVTVHGARDAYRVVLAAYGERPRTFTIEASGAQALRVAIADAFGLMG